MNSTACMITAARACLGTPFHHQGRQPHIGLDCIGLVVVALQACGMRIEDRQDYSIRPNGDHLLQALARHGALPVQTIESGDILLFRYDQQPQHVAIATDNNMMIHSFAPAGAVVETNIGVYWQRRLLGIYRFPLLRD